MDGRFTGWTRPHGGRERAGRARWSNLIKPLQWQSKRPAANPTPILCSNGRDRGRDQVLCSVLYVSG